MRSLFYLAIIVLTLLLNCSSDISGTSSDVDIKIGSINGKLVDNFGNSVEKALVRLYKGDSFDSLANVLDVVLTDSLGFYCLESIKSGIYHIQADYKDSLFVSRRNINHFEYSITDLDVDTMFAPGAIKGIIKTDKENCMGVLVYIPGTHYSAYTDSNGLFVLGTLAPSLDYSLACQMYGYATTVINNISVGSNDTTELDTIKLIRNLYPTGLDAFYDTSNGTVVLKWNSLQKENIAGYYIYRKDSRKSAESPLQLNIKEIVLDTFYVDTINEEIFSREDSIPLQYQVKAKTENEDLSPFSNKLFINVYTLRDSTTKKTLNLVSPLYLDIINGDSVISIIWDYTGIIKDLKLEFTANNGKSWFSISSKLKNNGEYLWRVPNITSDSCRIRIVSNEDSLLYDISDIFSIQAIENSNLLKNGDFSEGLAYWNFRLFENGIGYLIHEDGKCKLSLGSVPDSAWYVAINQENIPLLNGKIYRLSFDAKSTVENHLVGFSIALNKFPWTTYHSREVYISKDEKSYSLDLVMSSQDDLNAVFIINGATAQADLTFDNFILEEK